MNENFEIGIIGGGPAGSSAASCLADYGFSVCLFEKKSFPRETLCGEFLSAEVINFLKEQNLFNDFLSLKPNRIKLFRFFNNSGKSIKSSFDFEAYGLSRSLFDNLLLCNAKKRKVTVYQPADVKNIIKEKKSFRIIYNNGIDKEKTIKVKYLIAAYGKQNQLDNYLNRNFVDSRSRLNGIKYHIPKNILNDFPGDEIQIYSTENIYCGVNAVDNNKITFCFLENRKSEQPPPRIQLKILQEKNGAFKKLFSDHYGNVFDNTPVYGTGNIYFGKRNLVENGIFMIGDAGGVIAPLAGDGIGMAIESGKLIAELFSETRSKNLSHSDLEILYNSEWNNLFYKRMKTALFIQNTILNNFKRKIGFNLTRIYPEVLNHLIRSTRNLNGSKM